MSGLTRRRTEQIKEYDWRFAELVMLAWTDPALAQRYRDDPVRVLEQFGMRIDSPDEAPELRIGAAGDLIIEDLDRPSPANIAIPTQCGASPGDETRPGA